MGDHTQNMGHHTQNMTQHIQNMGQNIQNIGNTGNIENTKTRMHRPKVAILREVGSNGHREMISSLCIHRSLRYCAFSAYRT